MSVSSSTETFTDGPALFDQYSTTVEVSSDIHPQSMEEEFKKELRDRITPILPYGNGVRGTCRLDDVVVDCVTPAYRQHQIGQWEAVKTEAEDQYRTYSYSAIGTGILAALSAALWAAEKAAVASYVGATFAAILTMTAPVLLIAGCVGAIVSVIFCVAENSKIDQANHQIDGWNIDPVLKKGLERNAAHARGFPYIFPNLKLEGNKPSHVALFHPIQVQYEYEKYFLAFCKKLLGATNPSPVAWMKEFRTSNPLAAAWMSYGLGSIPEYMKPVIDDYSRFESFLSDVAKSYDVLKEDTRAAAQKQIEEYKTERNKQLQQFAQIRDDGIKIAQANLDNILKDLPYDHPDRKTAKTAFKGIKEALEANYARTADPINKKYNGKIKDVEMQRDDRLKKLDDQKGKQLGNNYSAARELLTRARQAWNDEGYQPVNFQLYFPYQQAQNVWQNQQPVPAYQSQPVFVPPQVPNIYPQVPQLAPGYGEFRYGYPAQPQIAQQQHYSYVPPSAPPAN